MYSPRDQMLPPEPDEGILGLDNVRLELPIAGAGSRVLAAFLDYLLVGILSVLLVVAAIAAGIATRGGWWIAVVIVVGLFAIDYGYFAGMEIATGGQTLGKRAVDLVVLDRQGGRAATAAFLIRNCVRTADVVIGIPLMVVDPLARRLGDRLAGTVVVHRRAEESVELLVRRAPRGWSGENLALLESFLRRSADLEPDRAQRIAGRLLAAIERDDPGMLAGVASGGDAVARLRNAVGRSAD
jgi:uncharacterized RDD family membrane protein YckC